MANTAELSIDLAIIEEATSDKVTTVNDKRFQMSILNYERVLTDIAE